MPSVSAATEIDRPPEIVFAALADPLVRLSYDRATLRSVEQLTPAPIGQGSRFRGDFRGLGMLEYEYTAFEPGRLIEQALQLRVGRVRQRFQFRPSGRGTRLIQTITLQPNILGRLLWSLLTRREMTRRARTLNALVKQYVER